MSDWRYTVTIGGQPVDNATVPRPLTIRHGRATTATQPDAPTCELTWWGEEFPGQLGDTVAVSLTIVGTGPEWVYDAADNYTWDSPDFVYDNLWAAPAGPRFVGRILQLVAAETHGHVTEWRAVCLGGQADWGHTAVLVSRPPETDIQRVQGIAAAAAAPVTVLGADTVTLAADVVDRTALDGWQQVCASSGGLIWQARDGRMMYGAADHRRTDPVGVLPASEIVDGLDWALDVDSVLNHLTVSWGPEGSQTQNTHTDAASITRWGQRHADVPTLAAAQPDADQLALLILARRSAPYWVMPAVLVDVTAAPRPVQHLIAGLDVGSIILAPIPVAPAPTPATEYGAWLVEGWVEVAADDGHTYLQLYLADAARWAQTRLRTWAEARTYTWAQEKTGSWLDALVMEGT